MFQTINMGAGSQVEFAEAANFFRIMQASASLTVRFYAQGREVVAAEGVSGGYAEEFTAPIDRVVIQSATAQQITFVMRLGSRVAYDAPPNGLVTVTNTAGAFDHAAHVVTSASGQLRAAKAARRYLLVQNNASSGDIFVRADGQPATAATGVKIGPGGSWEISGFVPTGAITAIGSIASNASIVTVEG